MTRESRIRRRELEAELRDVPTPLPPADLLDRIRDGVPAHLATPTPAGGRSPWHRRPLVRLAASLAVVAVGLTIATRVAEPPASTAGGRVAVESRAIDDRAAVAAAPDREPAEQAAPQLAPTEPRSKTRARAAEETTVIAPKPSTTIEERAPAQPGRVVVESGEAPAALIGRAREPAGDRPLRNAAATPRAASELESKSEPPGARRETDRERLAIDRFAAAERQVAAEPPQAAIAGAEVAGRLRRTAPSIAAPPPPRDVPPSTGGTAEPNDTAYGDMFFRAVGTNPFVDAAEDPLSTFALDVDTGSYNLARAYLERGELPPPAAIRVEELVNSRRYDDPRPRRGDFTLIAEGAPSPFAPFGERGDYRLLRFAVQGREIAARDRRPARLTFVVDVSGSMNRENRLGLVRRALGLLLDELRPEDRVALVVYGTRGRVLLPHTGDHEAIRAAIDELRAEGSTNAEEGLRLGYDLAAETFRPGASHRVILCSDGVANVGASGPESILARIGHEARRGIELTTVGFGMGNYNDALMEQLADQGDGRYHYVDALDEARRIFVEELTGTLETIARDAKVQVEFDPATVERWRLVGYENRDVADRDFRNDRVDAGELGAGHAATALYEIRLTPRPRRDARVATLRLRWHSLATGRVEEAALELRGRDLEPSAEHASAAWLEAAVAAELGELLKGSFYAREASWRDLVREAERLERLDRRDPGAGELADLVRRAAALAAPAADVRSDPRDRGIDDD